MDLSAFSEKPTRRVKLNLERVVTAFRSGLHRSKVRGLGMEFWGLRPYDPSDSPGQIDWLASARTSEDDTDLVSRVYHPEQQISVLCLVDAGVTMRNPVRKQEFAAFILRLFALSAFKYLDRFSVAYFTRNKIYASEWIHNEDDFEAFLSDIASSEKKRRYKSPHKTINLFLLEKQLHDTLIVVVSDFCPEREGIAAFFKRLDISQKNIGGLCLALDEWEGFLPWSSEAAFRDPRSGKRTVADFRPGGELSREKAAQEARFARIRKSLRSFQVPLVPVPIIGEPAEELEKALRKAGFH